MQNPIYPILTQVRYTQPQGQYPQLSMTASPASGAFFCNWCADTGLRKYSEGPEVFESDCNQCVDNPFAPDAHQQWLIATGQVPSLRMEGV